MRQGHNTHPGEGPRRKPSEGRPTTRGGEDRRFPLSTRGVTGGSRLAGVRRGARLKGRDSALGFFFSPGGCGTSETNVAFPRAQANTLVVANGRIACRRRRWPDVSIADLLNESRSRPL